VGPACKQEKRKEIEKKKRKWCRGLLGWFGSGLAQLASSTFFLFKPFPFYFSDLFYNFFI
jgi:hypothetical protein